MESKIKKMARAGYVAKGVVYGITGVLTLLAAFNMGGSNSGQKGVFKYLEDQPFGNAILVLMALGLLCYAGWRFYQSIKDPENIGSHDKGKLKRIGFFVSGLIYLGYAAFAVKTLIGSSSSGGGGKTSFLSGGFGVFVFAVVGLSLLGVCIFQIKKATSGKFLQKFGYKSITEEKRRKVIKNTGYMGIISRAVIFGIMAFFFLRAAYYSNTNDIKTTADAFAFLQDSAYGAWLMGLVAAGLVCYGIFMFMTAKYRKFQA